MKRQKLITVALTSLASCAGFLSTPFAANALLIIDPFTTGSILTVFDDVVSTTTDYCDNAVAGSPCSGTANGGGVLGGQREVRITTSPNPIPGIGVTSRVVTAGGFYRLSSDSDSFAHLATSRLRWDGSTINPGGNPDVTGFGQIDLTANGQEALIVNVLSQNDIGGGAPFNNPNSTLSFTIWQGSISSTSTIALPNGDTLDVSYAFPLLSFTGIDLTKITGIELTISIWTDDNRPSLIRLDTVQVDVPFEFSPVFGIASLGALFGLSHLRNRRKSSVSPNLEASKSEEDSLVS